jgi:hypothetical protein
VKKVVLVALLGCGGGTPPAHELPPQPSATATAEVLDAGPPAASVVKFDDLGISFAVPAGYHVMGDDELAARIRASANPHLQADLRQHASEKKGIPLLVLSQGADKPLNVTLSVVVVPADASPAELMAHQQSVMTENLPSFETTSSPKPITLDGVSGIAMTTRYDDARDHHRTASQVRLYVRNGLATLLVAVWPDGPADEAAHILDGLHFY